MRKSLSVVVLVLAFWCPVPAGIMHNPAPAPVQSPTPMSAVQEPSDDTTLTGEMHTPGVSETLAEAVSELMAVLPALF